MKQLQIRQRTGTVLTIVCVIVLLGVAGCTWSKDLKACQEENQALEEHITSLQYALSQADKAADEAVATLATNTQMIAANITYLVVEDDNLWRIAKEQLGDGKRYKEILALNPQITKDAPLAIGTILKMPPR